MREMKDSGVAWIGEIPEEWIIQTVKNYFLITRGRVIAKTEIEDEELDNYYPVYSSQTKNNGCLGYIPEFDFECDSLTWTTDGANAGTVFIRQGKYSITNVCGILLPKNNNFYLKYAHYSIGYSAMHSRRADINGYKIMSNEMATIPFVFPPLSEQQIIATYLDQKCTLIDALIANQQKHIEKLKAYKQSLITETVTKGLNPDVPMKDSGVEWIGEIPEGWDILQLSSVVTERKHKNIGMIETNLLSLSYGNVIIKNINTTDGLLPESFEGYNIIEAGDIVLRLTDLQNDHKSLRSGLCTERGIITSAYVTLANRGGTLISEYLHYLLHTFDIYKGFYGMGAGVRQGLNFDGIKKILLTRPKIEEQQAIVSYLDQKCTQIDNLISIKQRKIEKLQQYKKSVIYEYVTGKKEVK